MDTQGKSKRMKVVQTVLLIIDFAISKGTMKTTQSINARLLGRRSCSGRECRLATRQQPLSRRYYGCNLMSIRAYCAQHLHGTRVHDMDSNCQSKLTPHTTSPSGVNRTSIFGPTRRAIPEGALHVQLGDQVSRTMTWRALERWRDGLGCAPLGGRGCVYSKVGVSDEGPMAGHSILSTKIEGCHVRRISHLSATKEGRIGNAPTLLMHPVTALARLVSL